MTDFPDNPTLNQEFTAMGRTWRWNGTAWQAVTSSHTHPLSDLAQSSATNGQVPVWNGTAWVPQTPASGGNGGTPAAHAASHATGGADAISPASIGAAATSHTHAIADTTGLQAALDGKQAAGSYAPATGIAPSAITGTAVVDSDTRLTNSRTPTSHKASHATGGADALTPADIGAVASVPADTVPITVIRALTQAEYDALTTPDSNTFYVIV